MCTSLLAAALLLAAPKSHPKPSPNPQQQAYEKAKAFYEEVQYGEAIGVLDGLLARGDLSDDLRKKATLLIGFCQVGLGNIEAAEKRFRAVLSKDLDLTLPPGTSPKIRDQFERVRSAVLRERVAEAERLKNQPRQEQRVVADRPQERPAALVERPQAPPSALQAETPVYKKAWFWVVIGGAALLAGGAIATSVILVDRNTPAPGRLEVGLELAR
jgi:hypothetical protein